jgi:hypothetical protein
MSTVLIKQGVYNKTQPIANVTAKLVNKYTTDRSGGYIVVRGDGVSLPDRNVRVRLASPDDYVSAHSSAGASTQSDEQILARLNTRFNMLNNMAAAVKRGDVRAMIVSGPPGVGKSFGVESVLAKSQSRMDLLTAVASQTSTRKYEIVKGAISPIGLYCKLYQYRRSDEVIVFDDCDSVFDEPLALNLLKAALDSKPVRTINWNTDSFKLRNEDIPDSFEFRGSCIFITNLKFDSIKSKKLREHIEALESRCHYIDLTIDTDREKMLRIRQVINQGMLADYNMDNQTVEDILNFVDDNRPRLRELSLRTVLKIADLARAFPQQWAEYAESTILKR